MSSCLGGWGCAGDCRCPYDVAPPPFSYSPTHLHTHTHIQTLASSSPTHHLLQNVSGALLASTVCSAACCRTGGHVGMAHTTFRFIHDSNVCEREFACFPGRRLHLGRLHSSLIELPSRHPSSPRCPFYWYQTATSPPPHHHPPPHCTTVQPQLQDAQLRFSRGALTSPPPSSQSPALFILSNT